MDLKDFDEKELRTVCLHNTLAKCPYEFFPKGAWLYGWPYSQISKLINYDTGEEFYLLCLLNTDDPENLYYEPEGIYKTFNEAYTKMMEYCDKFNPFKNKKDEDEFLLD